MVAAAGKAPAAKPARSRSTTAGKGTATPARPSRARSKATADPGVVVDTAATGVPKSVREGLAGQVDDVDLDRMQAELEAEQRQAPVGPDGEIRPVQIGKKGKAGPEMVHIFTIGERQHFIPKNPTLAVLIQFMRDARTHGRDEATENLLTSVLGDANLQALASSPDVSEDDVADVFVIVSTIAFGALGRFRTAAGPS